MRPLHEIDLARIAPLPEGRQRKELEQIRNFPPKCSYAPFRSKLHDILNVQYGMFEPVQATPWLVIEQELERVCRPSDLNANLQVARSLHDFATNSNLVAREQNFYPLSMGAGRKVEYWLPILLSLEGRPLIPYIDPRRSHQLTTEARRFVYSMMHERIRAFDPDYADVQFAIFQFDKESEGKRKIIVNTDEGIDLFSFDQMEDMVNTTYALWREICEARELEAYHRSTGTRGPLL